MLTISTTVSKILYPRDGSIGAGNFVILATDIGVCKGSMLWIPNASEKLALKGDWGEYKGNREFRFKEVWHDLPTDPRAMLHYACELTKGIGAAMEAAIWDARGEDWQNIGCDEVPRLRAALLNAFRDTIAHLGIEKEKTEAIAWLISIGCTRNLSEKAYAKWKAATVSTVQADCYALAGLPNYSFRDVDSGLRRNFGITDTDPRRMTAATLYFMRQLADGPTVVPWTLLRDKIMQQGNIPLNLLCDHVAKMFATGELIPFPNEMMIALPSDYTNELSIWDFVCR